MQLNLLECRKRVTESCDIGSNELIGPVNSRVEGNDFVEIIRWTEIQVVHIPRQTRSERDGQLLL